MHTSHCGAKTTPTKIPQNTPLKQSSTVRWHCNLTGILPLLLKPATRESSSSVTDLGTASCRKMGAWETCHCRSIHHYSATVLMNNHRHGWGAYHSRVSVTQFVVLVLVSNSPRHSLIIHDTLQDRKKTTLKTRCTWDRTHEGYHKQVCMCMLIHCCGVLSK